MGFDDSGDVTSLVGLVGFVVRAQVHDGEQWWLAVETIAEVVGCEACGARGVGHGRRRVKVRDLPVSGEPVTLVWAKRIWRCPDADCVVKTWSESSEEIAARAVLTERARADIARRVGPGEESVAGVARSFGVAWSTAMDAVRDHGRSRVDHLSRLGAPAAIGLDETSFLKATGEHPTLLVTGIVDLDRGQLVDVVPARSAAAVEAWLNDKPIRWTAGIRHVVIDPYQPYANAVSNELGDARLVVDHFHVIRLANAALDDVRRRVQQDTLGHRGRKGDPLYRIRRRLLLAREKLSDDAFDRVLAWLERGDPDGEVSVAYLAKELLRDVYNPNTVFDARHRLIEFYELCDEVDVHELSRLAKTIRRWQTPLLRWHTTRLTNAGVEGTNLIIKNIKRLGFGFTNFENYRLRLLLRCGTTWKTRTAPSIRTRQPSLVA